jgi:hypothetical protein
MIDTDLAPKDIGRLYFFYRNGITANKQNPEHNDPIDASE